MTTAAHLWAIGYDHMQRADQVREEIVRLGWDTHYLCLLDVAVVVRQPDGSFSFDREAFPAAGNVLACTLGGFVAGLVLGTPLTGLLVGGLVGSAGSATATAGDAGVGDDFIREVEAVMKPGTSALFILDDEGDMEMILLKIRGLGGTVIKTNVDLERVKLVQSTLAGGSKTDG